jgi:hypothetical protein
MKIINIKFRLTRCIWIIITGLFLVIPFLINPDLVPVSICGFKNLTGLPCPACGMSHSLHALTHLRITDSVRFHPVGALLYLLVIIFFLKNTMELITKRKLITGIRPAFLPAGIILFLTAWLSVWIVRILAG